MAHNIVTLRRTTSTQAGLFGTLSPTGLVSLELNWRDNKRQVSCIPAGEYNCVWKASPNFGMCYHVTDVPGRSHILIHAANFAGLVSLGQRADLQGCIALGMRSGELYGQPALLESKRGVKAFVTAMAKQPFILKIEDAYD